MICASCPLRDASTIPSGLTPDVAAFFHPVVRTIQHLFERVPARRTSEHGRETLVHPADGSRDLRRRHVLGVARVTLHQIFLHFFELARLLLDHEYTASRTHDHEVCSPKIKNLSGRPRCRMLSISSSRCATPRASLSFQPPGNILAMRQCQPPAAICHRCSQAPPLQLRTRRADPPVQAPRRSAQTNATTSAASGLA